MVFALEGVPEDLPEGKYATRVKSATWEKITLEFVGPYNEDDPCLFPITKTVDEEN